MALISQSIKNLKGGVSQQPDILRFPDQGERQVNGWSSEVAGLQKRWPTVFVKRLASFGDFGPHPLIHTVNRDESERYQFVFTGTTVRIFDLYGNEKTVKFPEGEAGDPRLYIQTGDPRKYLKMVTVADYTFIVNTNRVILEDPTFTHPDYPAMDSRAIINIRGGQYGKTFNVFLNNDTAHVASWSSPDGSVPAHVNQVDSQYIADQLVINLNNAFTEVGNYWFGYKATAGAGYILIEQGTNVNPIKSLTCQDGYNNQLMNGFVSNVSKFSELPINCVDQYIVKVSGEASSDQDDYYVQYSLDEKLWKETVLPKIARGLNEFTMPHAIVRLADGNFELKRLVWQQRTCGDDESNQMPSFVDDTINDVFFWRNRLGFLSGENVCMSRSGEYFKMFPLSVANLVDTDPIDVSVSHNRISILKHAVPMANELLLWSDQAQFTTSASGVLTPTSIDISLTTEFEVDDLSRPRGIGRGVYFCSPRASFSSIRRYAALQDVSDAKSAEDISAHVPSYVPNGVFSINGSSTENFVAILTEGDQESIYIYKFLYINEQLAQQSWSKWSFPDSRILSCDMINSRMILTIETAAGISLETIEFTQDTRDFLTEPYRLYLDKKVTYKIPVGAYDDDVYETLISLRDLYGIAPASGSYYVVGADGDANRFEPPEDGWTSNPLVGLTGNREGETVTIGQSYEFLYEFSKLLIKKTDQNGGVQTEDIGRLQLRRGWVNYQQSGAFNVQVNQYKYTMSGNRVAARSMILNQESLDNGQFKFPIQTEATNAIITITSDTPSPVSIVGAGWEGVYNRRSRGI